jgi:hypothetical protein
MEWSQMQEQVSKSQISFSPHGCAESQAIGIGRGTTSLIAAAGASSTRLRAVGTIFGDWKFLELIF